MRAERSHRPEAAVLGPFDVVADPASISAFDAAIGAPATEIPVTFPIVWLSSPGLKAALREAVGPDFLPVHESLSFDYVRPLAEGEAYRLIAHARRKRSPPRLAVKAEVTTPSGEAVLSLDLVLRLVPLAEGQGA